MVSKRIIPVLLINDEYLVKTKQFKNPVYLGDPINAVKIFNEKEVDELIILDISATKMNRSPDYGLIAELASECFMPLTYGGGIKNIDEIKKLFFIGIEKVCINQQALLNFELIKEAVRIFGSQAIVLSVDVKNNLLGKLQVYNYIKKKNTGLNPLHYIKEAEENGIGEVFVNFVDREGMMEGYDLDYIKKLVENINIPIISNGGAGKLGDLKTLFSVTGVSAAAAGSLFVFTGKQRGILITYPDADHIKNIY